MHPIQPTQPPNTLGQSRLYNLIHKPAIRQHPHFSCLQSTTQERHREDGSRLLDEGLKERTRGISFFLFFSFLRGPTPGITRTKQFTFCLPAARIHNSNCQESKGPWRSLNPQLLTPPLLPFQPYLLQSFMCFLPSPPSPSGSPHPIPVMAKPQLRPQLYWLSPPCHGLIKRTV